MCVFPIFSSSFYAVYIYMKKAVHDGTVTSCRCRYFAGVLSESSGVVL